MADAPASRRTGNGGLRVRLWDLPTGKQLHAENDSFPDPALMVGTPDGRAMFLLATDTAFVSPLRPRVIRP